MQGAALEELVGQFREVDDLIGRMSLVYPKKVLETLVYTSALSAERLGKRKEVEAWCADLQENLDKIATGTHSYNVFVEEDKECNLFMPIVEITAHGVPHKHSLLETYLVLRNMPKLSIWAVNYRAFGRGAYVQRGERTLEVSSFAEALTWLMVEARRGINTQRYKGLVR